MNKIFGSLILLSILLSANYAHAQSFRCGTDVVNNANVDAAPYLSNCFVKARNSVPGSTRITIQIPAGRYYIGTTVNMSIPNAHIRTETGAGTCGHSSSNPCAVFIARPDNRGPSMVDSFNAAGLTVERIMIDGNIGPRLARYTKANFINGIAYNSRFHGCTGCYFLGVSSVRAPQGTGMEFSGDNARFNYSNFSDNGWGQSAIAESWADGLTVHSSANIVIENSRFMDNSDIGLILGGAPYGRIQNNLIGNHTNFGFAALMLDNFNNSTSGNFTGVNVSHNRILCNSGMCGIGINLGPKIWYNSNNINGYAATVAYNYVEGAKQGILNGGADGFNIYGNNVITNGAYTNGSCSAYPISSRSGNSVAIFGNNYGQYADQLTKCKPDDLKTLLIQLPSVTSTVALAYRQILGRNPDLGGGQAWSRQSYSTLRNGIASSAEARALVNQLYLDYLGRNAEPGAFEGLVPRLASGAVTIETLRPIFAKSAEALSNPYRTYGSRAPW